ncbi:MAG: hypothetical protein ACK4VI_06570 [Alphaproteobacteria bacterium]
MKSMKWGFLVLMAIIGFWGLSESSRLEDFRYIMASVLAFGVVYLIYRTWADMPYKIMSFSAALIAILAFFAQADYFPVWYLSAAEQPFPIEGYFKIWSILIFTIGCPIMTVVFYKFDDNY